MKLSRKLVWRALALIAGLGVVMFFVVRPRAAIEVRLVSSTNVASVTEARFEVKNLSQPQVDCWAAWVVRVGEESHLGGPVVAVSRPFTDAGSTGTFSVKVPSDDTSYRVVILYEKSVRPSTGVWSLLKRTALRLPLPEDLRNRILGFGYVSSDPFRAFTAPTNRLVQPH